jgi:aspartate dehydrogenase
VTKRVAVVGYGAIGSSIAERLCGSLTPGVGLVAVLMRKRQIERREYKLPEDVLVTNDVVEMMRSRPDIVVEAAGHAAVVECAPTILRSACELFILSTGALANDELSDNLVKEAIVGGGRIIIPSGALAGFDGLLALRQVGLTAVTYRSTKPPTAWRGTPAEDSGDFSRLLEPRVVFRGSARNAALKFPRNANLAVAIALAGVGLDQTSVELVADPHARANIGEVIACAGSSVLELKLTSAAFESNPKSSQITGLSVVAALANRSAVICFQ